MIGVIKNHEELFGKYALRDQVGKKQTIILKYFLMIFESGPHYHVMSFECQFSEQKKKGRASSCFQHRAKYWTRV